VYHDEADGSTHFFMIQNVDIVDNPIRNKITGYIQSFEKGQPGFKNRTFEFYTTDAWNGWKSWFYRRVLEDGTEVQYIFARNFNPNRVIIVYKRIGWDGIFQKKSTRWMRGN
jgi:hypothetical protein